MIKNKKLKGKLLSIKMSFKQMNINQKIFNIEIGKK